MNSEEGPTDSGLSKTRIKAEWGRRWPEHDGPRKRGSQGGSERGLGGRQEGKASAPRIPCWQELGNTFLKPWMFWWEKCLNISQEKVKPQIIDPLPCCFISTWSYFLSWCIQWESISLVSQRKKDSLSLTSAEQGMNDYSLRTSHVSSFTLRAARSIGLNPFLCLCCKEIIT